MGSNKADVTHVVVEDSVATVREKCVGAFKNHGIELQPQVHYLPTRWLSKCLAEKQLVDVTGYEIECVKQEFGGDPGIESPPKAQKRPDSPEVHTEEPPVKKERAANPSLPSTSRGSLPGNLLVVAELQKLADVFHVRKDQWRAYGYEKAISAISRHPTEIASFQEARAIPGVSDKMAGKIMEVLESGKLRKVDEMCGDEKFRILELFSKVWGAGPATAEAWYLQGHRTLDDLRNKARLTKQHQVGLRHYHDIQQRIPRHEVQVVGRLVEEALDRVLPGAEAMLVGSYRRGKPHSGDIDVMVVNDGSMSATQLLLKLRDNLTDSGLLTDDLINLQEVGAHRKYFGMCKVPGTDWPHRRIDIFVVPRDERATALVHYTGSAMYNRYMRLHAASLGMSLSEHGLHEGTIRKGADILSEGKAVPVVTEEDIFKALKLEYKTPEERDH